MFNQLEVVPDRLGDYRVIDIREPVEVAAQPFPHEPIELLPLSEWAGIEVDERPVLLVCRSGARSLRLTQVLREQGMENVYSLPGGILGVAARS